MLILANLPFALVGGVLAVFATGGSLSVGSLVGFVTLFGITMRNSIMLISHYEHLVTRGRHDVGIGNRHARRVGTAAADFDDGDGDRPRLVAAGDRRGEAAGHEIEGPMAIVILGGLITSTVLNLLVLPTLALRFGRFEAGDEKSRANPGQNYPSKI